MILQHPEVRYEVTDNCNANCIMCPRDKHTREHGVMDNAKYQASIDEIVSLGATRVVLTGFGEPLLDRQLEQKIAYAAYAGLNTYIITNGSAITANRAQGLIEAGLDEARISFYGMSAGTYNTVMRGLEYSKTQKNILHFLDLINQSSRKVKVMLNYIELPENEGEAKAFKDYWEPLVDYIEIWRPHNFGDGRDYRERIGEKSTCGRPANGPLQIQWNGEVIPCCYDYNNSMILGNAFEQPIIDILAGDRYNALRNAHASGEFGAFPFCDQCDQLLEHSDAIIYTNRHNLPPEEAVKLSNTDLYNLIDAVDITTGP